jgi:hypothetical protein
MYQNLTSTDCVFTMVAQAVSPLTFAHGVAKACRIHSEKDGLRNWRRLDLMIRFHKKYQLSFGPMPGIASNPPSVKRDCGTGVVSPTSFFRAAAPYLQR